jgi:hypothetical protein
MAVLFEVRDASNVLQLYIGNRAFRLLTIADTNAINGSMTVDSNGGEIIALSIPDTFADRQNPSVSVSGSTVSWSYSEPSANRERSRVVIMAY